MQKIKLAWLVAMCMMLSACATVAADKALTQQDKQTATQDTKTGMACKKGECCEMHGGMQHGGAKPGGAKACGETGDCCEIHGEMQQGGAGSACDGAGCCGMHGGMQQGGAEPQGSAASHEQKH